MNGSNVQQRPQSFAALPLSLTFGTLKASMGAIHFLTGTLPLVSNEMSSDVLAHNRKRITQISGVKALIRAIRTA